MMEPARPPRVRGPARKNKQTVRAVKSAPVHPWQTSSNPDQGGIEVMTNTTSQDAAGIFDPLRPKLMRIAYHMLGSVHDAEDIVQEAFLRWAGADRNDIREPEAFLRRTVTRLCLDLLKSARRRL